MIHIKLLFIFIYLYFASYIIKKETIQTRVLGFWGEYEGGGGFDIVSEYTKVMTIGDHGTWR